MVSGNGQNLLALKHGPRQGAGIYVQLNKMNARRQPNSTPMPKDASPASSSTSAFSVFLGTTNVRTSQCARRLLAAALVEPWALSSHVVTYCKDQRTHTHTRLY